jgi:hypothetical protein
MRIQYLRPILGHIHCGGLRFKDKIETAFRRQARMLYQSRMRLNERIVRPSNNSSTLPDGLILRALGPHSRDLHYAIHYSKPLIVRAGDIGYISDNPQQFTSLDNVYEEISDGSALQSESVQPLQLLPPDRWSTENIQGVVRCGMPKLSSSTE